MANIQNKIKQQEPIKPYRQFGFYKYERKKTQKHFVLFTILIHNNSLNPLRT